MDVQELWARLKNDVETLHAAQLTLQNENTKLQNENRLLKERFQRILLQQSLISLLQEGHSGTNLSELCRRLGIDSPEGSFVLIEFSNDSALCRSNWLPKEPFSDPEMHDLLQIAQDAMARIAPVIVAPYGDRLLCLLILPAAWEPGQLRQQITAQVEALNRQLTRFPLYTAVSSMVQGIRNLPAAFSAVKQLTDYKVIMEEHAPNILFADSLSPSQWGAPDNLVTPEQRHFVFYIRIGDFAHARQAALEFCRQKLLSSPTVQALPLTMAALKDTFIHTLGSSCTDLNLFDAYIQVGAVQRIAGAQTAQELEDALDQVLEELGEIFDEKGHSDSLPQRIKSYIDENYQDPETNVNAVADFFGISATYATKVFRGAYHSGVLDYIHQRRLFTAKELLGSGQSIAEIARQSGYGTSSNMIRAFKRIEGVTPGQLVSELETGSD